MFDSSLAGICAGHPVPLQLKILLQDDLDKREYSIKDVQTARDSVIKIDKKHFPGVFLHAFDKAVATHKVGTCKRKADTEVEKDDGKKPTLLGVFVQIFQINCCFPN